MGGENQYVFKEAGDGSLEFVGDFEGLYKHDPDPWEQSGEAKLYAVHQYYAHSRAQLIAALRRHVRADVKGLEVGCGHGHVTELLSGLTTNASWEGMDISPTAIKRARELYPDRQYYTGDMTKDNVIPVWMIHKYNVVVLGQLLWYIMHEMETVVHNCWRLLAPHELLVVSQAFLTNEQRYGREIANGFDGAVALMLKYQHWFKLVECRLDSHMGLAHNDGLIIMRKVD